MNIPGINLLNMAHRLIARQEVKYYRFLNRTTNENGLDIAEYAPFVTLNAGVQAVPQDLYERYGLEFQKEYISVFLPMDILDVDRDWSGDQMGFAGARYNCVSATDWHGQDGWMQVICLKVGDDA